MSIDVQTRWQLSDEVCRIAQEAGKRIMSIYDQDFGVETKGDNSPLTQADRAAHKAIQQALEGLQPKLPILSEEGAETAYEERRGWENFWLVDPLDGTKEFINKNGEFTVNIALIQDQRPILGVVYAPALGVTYLGVKGKGAFRITEDGQQPIFARTVNEGPLTVVASRSHRDSTIDALLARLPEHEITSVGSSLKFCRVAEGQADLYPRFGQTAEWDTAAAQCVVETAGGRVVDLDRTPLTYNTSESLFNPSFIVYGDPSHDWDQYLQGLGDGEAASAATTSSNESDAT
jgi:3'(2'), 5'-bisphosphate nucleotidase